MIFKNWAFRLFIYYIILNICITILILNRTPVLGVRTYSSYERNITIFEIMAAITFITGTAFSVISVIKNENKDYKYYIANCGFGLFLIYSIIMKLIN